jgi:hypothetical protein
MGNADPKVHDDAVMALAICVTASMTEGPYAEERTPQSDVFDIFNQQELV